MICEYCSTQQTLPKLDDDRRVDLYGRAKQAEYERQQEIEQEKTKKTIKKVVKIVLIVVACIWLLSLITFFAIFGKIFKTQDVMQNGFDEKTIQEMMDENLSFLEEIQGAGQ